MLILRFIAACFVSVAITASAIAQHYHAGHEQHSQPAAGPHGGSLQQVDNLQVETVLESGGLRLFVYDNQGKSVDVRAGRGTATLQIAGNAKKYRYDLFAKVGRGNVAPSLAAAVDLTPIAGTQVDLTYQIVGIPGAERRPLQFKTETIVPMTETQKVVAAIKAQGVCPVSGQPLGSMGKAIPVTIGDRTVYVCCAGCIDALKANAGKNLATKPTTVKTTAADAQFVAAQKVCPVMDEPLDAMGGPYKTVVQGRVVYLCCPGCTTKLHANPARYLKILADRGVTPPIVR